ncbi:hypothetical protein [Anaerosporobacter faecicola]|uniref:hypothetical protein n=1 Tax=Anaerosporobacter faecicola TaxID=2718714 RepID=UPI00143AC3FB|nr:hypothetical protein [Anaerosporobacter faecicola]
MIDLMEFAKEILEEAGVWTPEGRLRFITFLEDNDWFNIAPILLNEKVYLTKEQTEIIKAPLEFFFINRSNSEKETLIHQMFTEQYPTTSEQMDRFFDLIKVTNESKFHITDFLLNTIHKDIFLMNDNEIKDMISKAINDLIKAHGEILTFFLSWLKSEYKTVYINDYVLEKRISIKEKGQAYDIDEYLELLFYLYNKEYIEENDMYKKAANSKNYADTWLYLSMYYICALRITDLKRIKHPILPKVPELVIQEIREGTFSESDARKVLLTITWRLCVLPLTPHKTERNSGISSVKFTVPESCEIHIGTLFALCEAHRQIEGIPDDVPLIRNIQTYEEITSYMGEEIGSLFLEANFHSRSANKSYLQSIYMLTDDILSSEADMPNVKGYILAALARSHKGSYGEFARTTEVYLKDAKLSGLTPEFVAMELFERGVLSFVPSMLLKMISGGQYNKLTVHKQTELVKILDMSPGEIERTIKIVYKAKSESKKMVNLLLQNTSKDSLLEILHRIGSGSAFSKQPECLCLLTALRKVCPYSQRMHCIGCKYEISTKSTVFLITTEYNRLMNLFNNSKTIQEKEKYKKIITEVVLPSMDEMLTCIKEQYGQDTYEAFENMIKEHIT